MGENVRLVPLTVMHDAGGGAVHSINSGHFCKAAGYDMLSADNMVCRSNGSNYETVIVSLDHNSIWD